MNLPDFRHYISGDQLVIPESVQDKIDALQLRAKDILWTFNKPFKEKRYPEGKYKRERWFGNYWVGLLCKWSASDGKWVILACWREGVGSIS